jgi:hypothetical protein
MDWARREMLACRGRFRKKGVFDLEIEDDEILSLIGMLWTQISAGKVGKFRPVDGQPVHQTMQAYVGACLDFEIQRYLRCEGSRSIVHVVRGEPEPLCFGIEVGGGLETWHCRNAGGDENEGGRLFSEVFDASMTDERDPSCLLEEKQNRLRMRSGQSSEWPGPIGEILDEWIDRAYQMPTRDALAMRARRKIPGRTEAESRANIAWVIIQASAECDAERTRVLAPFLAARWIDMDNRPTRTLISEIYPGLAALSHVGNLASRESRNVLRYLAVEIGQDAAISSAHLQIASDDARDAMTNWVGKRGPYRRKQKVLPMQEAA